MSNSQTNPISTATLEKVKVAMEIYKVILEEARSYDRLGQATVALIGPVLILIAAMAYYFINVKGTYNIDVTQVKIIAAIAGALFIIAITLFVAYYVHLFSELRSRGEKLFFQIKVLLCSPDESDSIETTISECRSIEEIISESKASFRRFANLKQVRFIIATSLGGVGLILWLFFWLFILRGLS